MDGGLTIVRSIQSRSWPAARVNLEYAAIWGTNVKVADHTPRIADGVEVKRISTLLEPGGRIEGLPKRLDENAGMAFNGFYPFGKGFVIDPAEASEWIKADSRNADVLFPYLSGDDLNSRPDGSGSRWVIDFDDRSEEEAREYLLPFNRLLVEVAPVRASNNRAVRRERWWQFAERAPGLRRAIADLAEILVITRVSKTLMPVRIATGQVPSEGTVVFATENFSEQAFLSSSVHQMWSIKYGSGMRNDPRYTPSDVFETLPRPRQTDDMREIGETLDSVRREIMLRRRLGLTSLYNMVNDPGASSTADTDIARLREIHVELDEAVMDAYNWSDIALDHGFHTYRQMERFTISTPARVEILDRLLEENHRRAGAPNGSVSAEQEILFP